jgi:hypothetical protein
LPAGSGEGFRPSPEHRYATPGPTAKDGEILILRRQVAVLQR